MANSSWFSFKIRIVSNTNKHIVLNIFDSQGNEMKKYKIYKTKKKKGFTITKVSILFRNIKIIFNKIK